MKAFENKKNATEQDEPCSVEKLNSSHLGRLDAHTPGSQDDRPSHSQQEEAGIGDVPKQDESMSTSGEASMPARFPHHLPTIDLESAEQILFEELEYAAKLSRSGDDCGRSAAHFAIHVCYSFLLSRGFPWQALTPFNDLLHGFKDVAEGTLPELFDPKLKPGQLTERKWSRSFAADEAKIHAAACMDALMKRGVSKAEAAGRVARSSDNWARVSRGDIKRNTVVNWRDELLQQRSDNRNRQRFENRSRAFSQGPKAANYLTEALRDGPLTGGVRKKRKTET